MKVSKAFDSIQYNGGLKTVGKPSKMVNGVQRYRIRYQDLNLFLGDSWHFRGLNPNGDYGYVELETMEYSLQKSKGLVEYFPPHTDDESPVKSCTDTGYVLVFCFVSNYGTAASFGKDNKIFYQ